MHYEHEVKSCTICTDAFIEKWEIVVNIKVENAVLKLERKNRNSTHSVACGNLKRKFTSLWGRKQMLDMDRDKKNEQAEAELGQAQPQMRSETKNDVDI